VKTLRIGHSREVTAHLLAMGRAFHAKVSPPWTFSDQGFLATMAAIDEGGYLHITPRGFIAGVIAPNPLSDGWVIAKEFLWWSEDGRGQSLRQGFRKWAVERGANEIQWSCPPNERVERVYARSAQKTEIIYSEYL